jgi:hypothetical protein
MVRRLRLADLRNWCWTRSLQRCFYTKAYISASCNTFIEFSPVQILLRQTQYKNRMVQLCYGKHSTRTAWFKLCFDKHSTRTECFNYATVNTVQEPHIMSTTFTLRQARWGAGPEMKPLTLDGYIVLIGHAYSTIRGAVIDGYGAMVEWLARRTEELGEKPATSSTKNLIWRHALRMYILVYGNVFHTPTVAISETNIAYVLKMRLLGCSAV